MLATLPACAPVLASGTGALAAGAGVAPVVRISPADNGSVFVHGLELLPSGDRLLLVDAGGKVELGKGPQTLALQHALLFAPDGNLVADHGLPCHWRQPSLRVRGALLGRGGGGLVVGCVEELLEAERTALPQDEGRGLALRLIPIEGRGFGGDQTRLIVPGLSSVDSLLTEPPGGLLLAGMEGKAPTRKTSLVRLTADGNVAARARVGTLQEAYAQVHRLIDGDVLFTEIPGDGALPERPLRVARLSGSDLSVRWERTLNGIGTFDFGAYPHPPLVTTDGERVYLGTSVHRKGTSESHPAIFTLSLADGALRWQEAFEGEGETRIEAITASPGGGVVVAMVLQPGSEGGARLSLDGKRFTNSDAYDADLVLAWLSPEGRRKASRHWEADSERSTASVFIHLAHQPDGALVVAGNFFRRMFLLDRWVVGPSRRLRDCNTSDVCPVDEPSWHGPRTKPCCKDRVSASGVAYIVTILAP